MIVQTHQSSKSALWKEVIFVVSCLFLATHGGMVFNYHPTATFWKHGKVAWNSSYVRQYAESAKSAVDSINEKELIALNDLYMQSSFLFSASDMVIGALLAGLGDYLGPRLTCFVLTWVVALSYSMYYFASWSVYGHWFLRASMIGQGAIIVPCLSAIFVVGDMFPSSGVFIPKPVRHMLIAGFVEFAMYIPNVLNDSFSRGVSWNASVGMLIVTALFYGFFALVALPKFADEAIETETPAPGQKSKEFELTETYSMVSLSESTNSMVQLEEAFITQRCPSRHDRLRSDDSLQVPQSSEGLSPKTKAQYPEPSAKVWLDNLVTPAYFIYALSWALLLIAMNTQNGACIASSVELMYGEDSFWMTFLDRFNWAGIFPSIIVGYIIAQNAVFCHLFLICCCLSVSILIYLKKLTWLAVVIFYIYKGSLYGSLGAILTIFADNHCRGRLLAIPVLVGGIVFSLIIDPLNVATVLVIPRPDGLLPYSDYSQQQLVALLISLVNLPLWYVWKKAFDRRMRIEDPGRLNDPMFFTSDTCMRNYDLSLCSFLCDEEQEANFHI